MFLSSNNLLHHLYSRVVLTAIALTLGLDGDLLKHLIVGLKTDLYVALYARVNIDGLRHIAYRGERKLPTIMTCYLEVSIDIGSHTHSMTQVLGTGKRYWLTGLGIDDLTGNSMLCICSE